MKGTFEEVVDFLKHYAEFEADQVSRESQLRADLGLDSIDLMALVDDSESEFDIIIEDNEIASINTIGDIVDMIEKKNN